MVSLRTTSLRFSTVTCMMTSAWIHTPISRRTQHILSNGIGVRRPRQQQCYYSSTTTTTATALSSSSSSTPVINHLEGISSLRNDYFALRHGQSMANVAGIIASNPKIACEKYGLSSPVGKDQAIQAGQDVVKRYHQQQEHDDDTEDDYSSYSGILILTSDLLRAKETAEASAAAATEAGIPNELVIETRFRERGFGEWDGGSDVHYKDVWKDDVHDPGHELKGVESVNSVTERATKCIRDWDEKVKDHMILCVAHGDVLQILQTAFSKMDGSQHRTLDHLETATLRPLVLKP